MNSFGAMLKRNRKLAGLTQEQLAEKLDVSTVAVQNWESGKNQIRSEKLTKLSYLFNIPLETLIHEMLISEERDQQDSFPYFLFDDDTNDIVRTLHLTLSQQELFGILYIYHAEFLDREEMDSSDLRDDLKLIPYEFVSRFGSINLLNIAEGLYKVLKYVQTDFLVRALRLNPEKEFDVCRLSMELICDFIDSGHKRLDESDWNADYDHVLWFHIDMHKAMKLLPELDKGGVHLTNGRWANDLCDDVPLWLICYDDDIPEYLQCRREEIPEWYGDAEKFKKEWNSYHNPVRITSGIKGITDYSENDNGEWTLSINETGKELLKWFRKNES
nr:MAG TPA: helix-turn-helix domain protein [Caudoviricetes sp.]